MRRVKPPVSAPVSAVGPRSAQAQPGHDERPGGFGAIPEVCRWEPIESTSLPVRDEATAAERLADLCQKWQRPAAPRQVTPRRLTVPPPPPTPCPFCGVTSDAVDTGETFASVSGVKWLRRACRCGALSVWQ